MRTVDVLIRARNLISNKNHWTREIEDNGYGRYCAVGAVKAVTKDMTRWDTAVNRLNNVSRELFGTGVVTVNDRKDGHRNVMRVYAEAIRQLLPKPKPLRRPHTRRRRLLPVRIRLSGRAKA